MIKRFAGIFFTWLFVLTFLPMIAIAQESFRRNDHATLTTTQPNTAPFWSGASVYGEAYTADKPGLVACSAANTGTTAVNIIAGVAGVSHIVSSVQCRNNTTVASLITLRNNLTSIGEDYIGTTTLGNNRVRFEFPKPILIEGAKPLTFIMGTTSTSTV